MGACGGENQGKKRGENHINKSCGIGLKTLCHWAFEDEKRGLTNGRDYGIIYKLSRVKADMLV